MFHKVTIIGNVGGEPESRPLPSGDYVCNFSVATNRKWKNSDGTPGEETVWWRVSAWGRLGEVCQQYLTKGQLVFIEGTMVPDRENGGPRIWTDQSGQPRASYELRCDTMKMLGRPDASYDGGGYSQSSGAQQGGYGGQSQPASRPAQQRSAPAPTRQAPQSGGRRSTTSAPRSGGDDFDHFDPDEIPF